MRYEFIFGVAFAALMCAAGSACSSDSSDTPQETTEAGADTGTVPTFPADPLMTAQGDNALLNVAIRMSPETPVVGTNSMEITVTDNDGNPVDGLTIAVTLSMPEMPMMPASPIPSYVAQGNGKYLSTNVKFSMPGLWMVDITLTGSISDHVAPTFTF
ncbi:MAG: FixH family protein [Polyangiaceae bacterium]|nr:FixH family protein [Polyangiaceae bacterium]